MRAWRTAAVVGLVLVLVGAEARASEGDGPDAPPPPPAPAAGVEITVADTISDAETIRGWSEERAASVLSASERALERGEVIRVAVRGRAFDYEITVELVRHGQVLDGENQSRPVLTCECGNEELLDRVGEAVAAGAKALGEAAEREREDAARVEAERRREQEELQRQEAERAVAKQPTHYRPSMLGRAGFGALGAGGVLTLSGIIMAVQPRQYVATLAYVERDWLVPGAAFIGIGTSAMATGVVIVIVDAVRCRRNRAQCGARAAAWSTHGTARVVARSGGGR